MFKATKRNKYIIYDELRVPTDSQCIVQIIKPRGSQLYEVINPAGEQYLVSMPNRYRKMIWVKRGDYVLTDPIKEGDKVKGEIVKRLTERDIKSYRTQKCWPSEFDKDPEKSERLTMENDTRDDDDRDLFVNTNRGRWQETDDSENDSTSSDTD
ncbi:probable RNA-binding protein EIF1AD [Harpegnathos saltator]|uniref:Probable RNA-binding protein EIF1AD n=1 Tax=Harpegnathos saltator TaxID=610380 RepID=E2BGR9_HARSA|nr:probable RNA-binding protein EIF1AD [Harpegnathos saltator]EFN85051.1 Probable RNA-binding protein EIF1AD [Harpegnathos saltator]